MSLGLNELNKNMKMFQLLHIVGMKSYKNGKDFKIPWFHLHFVSENIINEVCFFNVFTWKSKAGNDLTPVKLILFFVLCGLVKTSSWLHLLSSNCWLISSLCTVFILLYLITNIYPGKGMLPWWSLLGLLSWCPVIASHVKVGRP